MKNKDIKPLNEKGNEHGYWEVYYDTSNQPIIMGSFNNGREEGFWDVSPTYAQARIGGVYKLDTRVHIYFII